MKGNILKKSVCIVLMVCFVVSGTPAGAHAEEGDSKLSTVGKGVAKVGKEVIEGGLDVGKGVGKGAKAVGEGALDVAKKTKELFFDPIIVSATRLPSVKTRLSDAPANMSVVTADDIEASGARTIQEALQYSEGINIYDSVGNGVDASFNLRGFTNNEETAVIVDGVRVNETDLNAFNPNLLDVDTIEQIELVRGSSSALFGDSVFGNVLNVTTKHPSDKLSSPFGYYEFGSSCYQNFLAGVSGTVRERYFLDIPGNLKYYFSGKRRLNDGFRDNGDTRGTFFDGKLGYELEDESGEVMFYIKYTDQENRNPGELTIAELNANRQATAKPDDNRKWENLILSVNANKSFLEDHIDVSFNAYRRLNDIDFISTYRSGTQEEFFTFSTQKGLVGQVTYNETVGFLENQFVAGVDYSNAGDNYEKAVLAGASTAVDNSLDKDDTGFYFQETVTLYEKLVLLFGMRHDEVDFRFEDHNNPANNAISAFDETTFKTGFVVKPLSWVDIYGNFAEAFKAPGASEMFNTTGWGSNDPGLKPEEANSYEVGTRLRWHDIASFNINYFRIDTEEEIQSVEIAAWTYQNMNVGKTRREGIETSLKIRPLEYLDTYLTYTLTDASIRAATTNVESGEKLGQVPQNRFTAGIHLGPIAGFNVRLDGVYVGEQLTQSAETTGGTLDPIKHYYVLNSGASYTYKNVELYCKVNNLLDRKYYTRGIYGWGGTPLYVTPAPEREFLGGVRVSF